ncbi:MAG: histidine phosphatase family protein [Planctomycetota bacterium]
MKRRLILMRHAKSSWADAKGGDHARTLNPRGHRQAPRIGALIREIGWQPDTVWASDARRCKDTLDHLSPFLDGAAITFLETLYLVTATGLIERLRSLPEGAERVLVLGHNPGWSDAVTWLAGGAPVELKTAHAALLENDDPTWGEALGQPGRWRHVGTLTPDD